MRKLISQAIILFASTGYSMTVVADTFRYSSEDFKLEISSKSVKNVYEELISKPNAVASTIDATGTVIKTENNVRFLFVSQSHPAYPSVVIRYVTYSPASSTEKNLAKLNYYLLCEAVEDKCIELHKNLIEGSKAFSEGFNSAVNPK